MTSTSSEKHPLAFIIEDDDALASGYAIAIDEAGYTTRIFRAGRSAFEQLKTDTPDLLLLDLNLPNVSGEEILTTIREDERLADKKVIVVSADANWARFLKGSANVVLIKPVGFKLLRDIALRFKEE
jgi:DNA-binding response OmpR family regulator